MPARRGEVVVVGAGVMGTGIAALALGHGRPVTVVDIGDEVLATGRRSIAEQLRHAQLMGALPEGTEPGKLTTSTDPGVSAGAEFVVEAVTEVATLKREVLAGLIGAMRPGTPLISNTSGIPIAELAVGLSRPQDLIGIHFMNPPYLIELVEIVPGPLTSPATLGGVTQILASLGRRAIEVRDVPGFVTSRLLHPMINQAARLTGEGVADAAAVDALMQGCLGHRVGPLRTADLIGIDNLVDSLNALFERTGEPGCRPVAALLDKVDAGHLGRKSGRGFYDYSPAS